MRVTPSGTIIESSTGTSVNDSMAPGVLGTVSGMSRADMARRFTVGVAVTVTGATVAAVQQDTEEWRWQLVRDVWTTAGWTPRLTVPVPSVPDVWLHVYHHPGWNVWAVWLWATVADRAGAKAFDLTRIGLDQGFSVRAAELVNSAGYGETLGDVLTDFVSRIAVEATQTRDDIMVDTRGGSVSRQRSDASRFTDAVPFLWEVIMEVAGTPTGDTAGVTPELVDTLHMMNGLGAYGVDLVQQSETVRATRWRQHAFVKVTAAVFNSVHDVFGTVQHDMDDNESRQECWVCETCEMAKWTAAARNRVLETPEPSWFEGTTSTPSSVFYDDVLPTMVTRLLNMNLSPVGQMVRTANQTSVVPLMKVTGPDGHELTFQTIANVLTTMTTLANSGIAPETAAANIMQARHQDGSPVMPVSVPESVVARRGRRHSLTTHRVWAYQTFATLTGWRLVGMFTATYGKSWHVSMWVTPSGEFRLTRLPAVKGSHKDTITMESLWRDTNDLITWAAYGYDVSTHLNVTWSDWNNFRFTAEHQTLINTTRTNLDTLPGQTTATGEPLAPVSLMIPINETHVSFGAPTTMLGRASSVRDVFVDGTLVGQATKSSGRSDTNWELRFNPVEQPHWYAVGANQWFYTQTALKEWLIDTAPAVAAHRFNDPDFTVTS